MERTYAINYTDYYTCRYN